MLIRRMRRGAKRLIRRRTSPEIEDREANLRRHKIPCTYIRNTLWDAYLAHCLLPPDSELKPDMEIAYLRASHNSWRFDLTRWIDNMMQLLKTMDKYTRYLLDQEYLCLPKLHDRTSVLALAIKLEHSVGGKLILCMVQKSVAEMLEKAKEWLHQ